MTNFIDGCPFYINRSPYPAEECGLPQREVNRRTFNLLPPEIQSLYERQERMPGIASTEVFIRKRPAATRWVRTEQGWEERRALAEKLREEG